MKDTGREREAETQEEGEAGSMQGARCGTRSQDSRITPWVEGGAKPLRHPGIPIYLFFKDFIYLFMRDTHREREREREREKGRDTGRGSSRLGSSRLHAGSLTWDSILGLQDHTLG